MCLSGGEIKEIVKGTGGKKNETDDGAVPTVKKPATPTPWTEAKPFGFVKARYGKATSYIVKKAQLTDDKETLIVEVKEVLAF